MFIKRLKLENFKGFKKLEMEFPAITLLLGANSSGKSSVLAGILGLLQSENLPLLFSPNGQYLKLGDFEEIVYGHGSRGSFQVGIELVDGGSVSRFDTTWKMNPMSMLPKLVRGLYESENSTLEISTTGNVYHVSANYDPRKKKSLPPEFEKSLNDLMEGIMKQDPKTYEYWKQKSTAVKCQLTVADLSTLDHRLWQNLSSSAGGAVVQQRQHTLAQFKDGMRYVGAFREAPQRTYYERTDFDLDVTKQSENFIHQVVAWEYQKSPKFKELVNAARQIGLFESIRTIRHHGGRFDLRVKVPSSTADSALIDSGFGISQFLPIIVGDSQLADGGTLISSQPEIHLHPSAQAAFATYIADQFNTKGKRYIIETHSEYIFTRLRLLVANGSVKESDVAVYYFSNARSGIKTSRIKLKKDGRIINAPREFFETYAIDTIDLALAASQEPAG